MLNPDGEEERKLKMTPDRHPLRHALPLLACGLLVLSAAAAQAHPPAAVGKAVQAQSTANRTQLYVGLFNGALVNVYDAFGNGQPNYQLVDGLFAITGGIAIGRNQEVFISTGSTQVIVFKHGALTPLLRYHFPDQYDPSYPLGIAVGSDGTLYAPLNIAGVVAVYPRGDTQQASLTIPVPSGETPYAVAVDSQNNLYIEYGGVTTPSPAYIEKCAPGSTQCTDLGVQLGSGGFNLVVDNQSNVIACDDLAATIDVFAPGSTEPRVISQGLTGCGFFALDKKQKNLYVGNQPQDLSTPGVISVFDYASGTLVNTISGGIPADDYIFGVALSPAER
jgi:hypothetical protein